MRILGIDPGAKRLGWAVIESGEPLKEVDVGISGLERHVNGKDKEKYQEYRLRLIEYWMGEVYSLFKYEPDKLVNEIVPSVGGGNFIAATQSQLASAALTVIQCEAIRLEIPIVEFGATTVKKMVGGTGKATKVQVRNGVYDALPSTERFRKEWVEVHDASDACAIALTGLGYKV